MANNTITIELCAEDRARLDRLAAALAKASPVEVQFPQPVMLTKPEPVPQADPAPWDAPVAQAVPQTAPVPLSALQGVVAQLVTAGKKEQAKAILNEYALRVSEVPEEKRAELLERLKALGGE